MKKTIILACLLCLGASDQPRRHAVVILQSTPAFTRLNPASYQYSGMSILCSSSSSNAPVFEPATFNQDGTITPSMPIAEALAQLLDQGYRLQFNDGKIIAIK
jgi:hypothetical protein